MSTPLPPHAGLDSPSAWVQRFAKSIPSGEVLDLACGFGRHARLLAALGYSVLAVDKDPAALRVAAGTGISEMLWDLEKDPADVEGSDWPFEEGRFAGIVVTNYLHRPLFPHLFQSLAVGGVLIYETFAVGNAQFGKPSNPAFLLHPGELFRIAEEAGARIVAFEDGYVDVPKPAMIQRICAIRPGPSIDAKRLRLT